ncbi:MAG: response regulator [Tateyamaria sp.]|uniref:response regulator transcription factor n=1 Tax=Tateyamaria sp. TaxID=1929288 RepID=UPI00329B3F27
MNAPHLLIVDDDPHIRSVLRIALGQAGYDVTEAGDGAEGLAKARSGRFDLIVLDSACLKWMGWPCVAPCGPATIRLCCF